jgi:hypothetical protein
MAEPEAFQGDALNLQTNEHGMIAIVYRQGEGDPSLLTVGTSEIVRSLEKRGQKRPLESVFDWFSWYSYNAGRPSKGS